MAHTFQDYIATIIRHPTRTVWCEKGFDDHDFCGILRDHSRENSNRYLPDALYYPDQLFAHPETAKLIDTIGPTLRLEGGKLVESGPTTVYKYNSGFSVLDIIRDDQVPSGMAFVASSKALDDGIPDVHLRIIFEGN